MNTNGYKFRMASCISIGIKLIAITTLISGVGVLGVCGWTLSNTFLILSLDDEGKEISEQNSTDLNNIEEDIKETNNRLWESMSDNFRVLIQGCTAASIVCALIQLIVSMIVVCSPAKKILGKARIWQWTHFNIILLLIICILVPLSYNREKDSFRGSSSFTKYMKNELGTLYNTIIEQSDTFIHFFLSDLNSYYFVLGVDSIILLILLIFSCCFTRCRCSDDYEVG